MTQPPGRSRPFSIRYLEEMDQAARLGWVRSAIAIGLFGYVTSFIFEFLGDTNRLELLTEGVTILFLTFSLWLSFRGSIARAAALTVLPIWAEIHASMAVSGELIGVGSLVLPALVAATGLLLGGGSALVLASITSVSAPGVTLLGRVLQDAEPLASLEDVKPVVILALSLIALAAIMSFGLQYLGQVLASARGNERRFSDLVAGNPDGIIALDPDGRIEALNPAAERILDISEADAKSTRLAELPFGVGFHLSTRLPESGPELNPIPMEQTLGRPDGTESRVEVVRQPLTRPDGSQGLMLILRDLTDRREMEARATQFGRIVEEARNEIYVFRRDTLEVLMANRGARENLGYDQAEIRGLAMFQIQPTLSPETGKTLAQRLFEDGEELVTVTTIHHRKDGTVYPLEVRFQKGFMEGEPAILAFGTDITEKEAAEEEQRLLQAQLQHAQKMEAVGLLAGGVAHDFNNLLTVIGGCGEILLDIGDDDVKGLTREILEAQERGAALTQQLLAFARRDIVQVEDLSMSEVVQSSEVLIRRVLGEKVNLSLELEDETPVRADRGQIEQVVLNLAANARDAMAHGGTLTIRVQKTREAEGGQDVGDFVALTVEDTGHGMDPRTLERVFEPFYTTKPRGKGTGLGLSTVHGIVNQNGGRISVESEPGEGTRIRILWPPAQPDAEIHDGGEEEIPAPTKETILLAEDEEGARTLIRTILEREGYRVVGVENGQQALDLIRDPTRGFDLLLTDIVMPGVNGLELADRVRDLRPGLPILFMSGFVDTNLQGPEGKPGSLNLLAKPFRPAELRKRVREILGDGVQAPTP